MSYKKIVSLFILIVYAALPAKSLATNWSDVFSGSNVAKVGAGIGAGLSVGLVFGYYFWKKNQTEKVVVYEPSKSVIQDKKTWDNCKQNIEKQHHTYTFNLFKKHNKQLKSLRSEKDAEQKKLKTQIEKTQKEFQQKIVELKQQQQNLKKFADKLRQNNFDFLQSNIQKQLENLLGKIGRLNQENKSLKKELDEYKQLKNYKNTKLELLAQETSESLRQSEKVLKQFTPKQNGSVEEKIKKYNELEEIAHEIKNSPKQAQKNEPTEEKKQQQLHKNLSDLKLPIGTNQQTTEKKS